MYERSVLLAEVNRVIRQCWVSLDDLPEEGDGEEKYIDIRLQLVDGTYYVKDGDSQYDTDHRGSWGKGSVCESTEDFDALAEEIVDEALDNFAMQQQDSSEVETDQEDDDRDEGLGSRMLDSRIQPENSPAALLLEKIDALLKEHDAELYIIGDRMYFCLDDTKYNIVDVKSRKACTDFPRTSNYQKVMFFPSRDEEDEYHIPNY